jgi:AraC-like DNA-binding protein
VCHPEWARARARAHHLDELARLRRVRDRIDREYARPLDVEELARGAHMSVGHLGRGFREAYGRSPHSYLAARRVERAAVLLRHGGMSVAEALSAVGCSSPGTFGTRFAELLGTTPGAHRSGAGDPALRTG